MTTSQLPISRLIQGTVNLSPNAAQAQNLNTELILGSSPVIDVVSRMREYESTPAVAADFGTTAPEYLAAVDWFGQSPQPANVLIGRWAENGSSAQLIGSTLSTAQQDMTVWNAVTNGGFDITIDGTAKTITGLNFSAATNLNGVAADITTALGAAGACVWNESFAQFQIASASTGATSTLTFATAPASGTDISSMLGMTASSSGAYVAQGIAAETAVAAATLFDNQFGQQWYGLTVCGAQDADHLALAAFIESTTNKHFYGVTTQEAGVLNSVTTTDIAAKLQAAGFNKTCTQYSSNSAYAVNSLLGRQLTVDYTGNNTVITLMYKQEPGVAAETLNATQMSALEGKNCNVFVAYNNGTTIIEPAKVASGEYIDTIVGMDAFCIDVQTALFNELYTSTTKIPQTDAGMHLLATVIEGVCQQYVNNGLFAPGVWNSGGFGTLNQGDFLAKGYYVYQPPVASQSQADRAARKSVPFQIAVKLAGAVHTIDFAVTVNQ
jgi:hypothetical protein